MKLNLLLALVVGLMGGVGLAFFLEYFADTVTNPDGVRKSTYIGTATYTGGTGIYRGIRGVSRATIVFDPDGDLNVGTLDLEYWLEK